MKYLITSGIPYVNGVKHLGNLVGSMLPADVYAKYLRAKGENVLFICGTDEHGTPAELAARKANVTPKEYCDKWHKIQKDLCEAFGIEFNYFGRTSDPENHELTQYFAKKLKENGFIEERTIKQIFSIDDNMFLADRYIEGICPKCGSNRARGDQCDACNALLDPTDLINPYSSISKSHNLEIRETRHLYLKQSLFITKLKEWTQSHIEWPDVVKTIAADWLESRGLEDRCITRDLKWGIPVLDWPGLENKVFYVWFDAPIGYISISKKWSKLNPDAINWKEFWYNTKDTKYIQFIGKDNIPFHTINFPITLMGTNEQWKLVDYIKGVHWLNYYNDKFSTSRHYGIFMDDALKLYPSDYWRYYLMSRIPENKDSNFTWEDFADVINKDLANVLGNFINRIFALINKYFKENLGILSYTNFTTLDQTYRNKLYELVKQYCAVFEQMEFRKAITSLRQAWVLGNEYIAVTEPWTLKNNIERLGTILNNAVHCLAIYGILSEPFIPTTSRAIQHALGLNEIDIRNVYKQKFEILSIKTLDKPQVFFEKISNEDIENYKIQFGGK